MIRLFKSFIAAQDGAVTVDWVVLTAAVVGLAALAYAPVQSGSSSATNGISNFMASQPVGQIGATEEE